MVVFDETQQKKRLAEFRHREEESIARMLADRYGVSYASLAGVPINTDALSMISEEKARKYDIAAFAVVGKHLKVAARIPGDDNVQDIVDSFKNEGYDVTLYSVSKSSLERAWAHYEDISSAQETTEGELNIASEDIAEFLSETRSRSDVKELLRETFKRRHHGTTRVLEVIVAGAVALRASDVHIETADEKKAIRMRIDGVLQKIMELDDKTYRRILSRVKLLSGLKLNIKKTAQDGRFSINIGDREIEIRTSVIPGAFGESMVLRVLDQATLNKDIEELGMQPNLLDLIRKEINKPNGLILNTGPTGSGKTTTLYSFLQNVNRPGIKTITIEDPIEYHLDNIVQTQVQREKDYDFFDGLRSGLRQDPDIIMVGEIRDNETAKTALHAGLTGHLVFSTLHTNDAAGTFPRLVELGVDKSLIGSAMNVAMAQRLVRQLCKNCREKIALEGELRDTLMRIIDTIQDPSPYQHILNNKEVYVAGEGCSECGETGYLGRIGIFEAIIINDHIAQLVEENPSSPEIVKAARQQGILSMVQDGAVKILDGITDLQELKRVVDIEKHLDLS